MNIKGIMNTMNEKLPIIIMVGILILVSAYFISRQQPDLEVEILPGDPYDYTANSTECSGTFFEEVAHYEIGCPEGWFARINKIRSVNAISDVTLRNYRPPEEHPPANSKYIQVYVVENKEGVTHKEYFNHGSGIIYGLQREILSERTFMLSGISATEFIFTVYPNVIPLRVVILSNKERLYVISGKPYVKGHKEEIDLVINSFILRDKAPTSTSDLPAGEASVDMTDWQTYTNKEFGIELQHPASWEISEAYSQVSFLLPYPNHARGSYVVNINFAGGIPIDPSEDAVGEYIRVGTENVWMLMTPQDDSIGIMIFPLQKNPPSNWGNENSLFAYYISKEDGEILKQILSTIKFI